MRRLLLSIAILLSLTGIYALTFEQGSMRGFLYGSEPGADYDNWLSHVSENIANPGFNQYALWDRQTPGFGSFRSMPDSLITPWAEFLNLYASQDFTAAQNLLETSLMPFNVIHFNDLDSGREYYLIRENLNQDIDDNGTPELWDDETGSFDYGWGLYVFNPYASNPIIVTAPHPCDDYPSAMMALEAFEKLNARYLMINGAGREVAYSGTQYYNNNSSLSDPSRNPDHPFNVAYRRFADEIRTTFGRMEFSLQVHSFDWASQQSQPSVQLSAGNGRYFPCLPIRDWSRSKLDLIHQAPYEVHPAASIGSNEAVHIDDYYSVYYGSSSPVWYTRDGHDIQLPNNQNYPGSMQNQQMLYTEPQYNSQTFSPFLHVEMDELPKAYEQTEENLKWFYGWDAEDSVWNPEQRYTRFRQFYLRWIDDLALVVPQMLILNDQELPSDPANLYITGNNYQLTANWERSYAYDFETYELEVSYEANGEPVTNILQQSDYAELGRQNRQSFSFNYGYLPAGNLFSFRIRARDLQGNLSNWSNSASASSASALITQVSATEYPERIRIQWSGTSSQTVNIRGAKIYRSLNGQQFELYDSWIDNPALVIPGLSSGFYDDVHVLLGTAYYYKVSVVLQSGYEHLDHRIVKGSPYRSYPLIVSNQSTGQQYSFAFGEKIFANDGPDLGLDVKYSGNPTLSPLLLLSVLEEEEDYHYLSKDIRAHFDPSEAQKVFDLELWTSSSNSLYSFSFGDSLSALAGSLILRNNADWSWHDLLAGPVELFIPESGPHSFSLLWGYQEPLLSLNISSGLFVSQGDTLLFEALVQPAFMVESIDFSLVGEGLNLSLYSGLPPALNSFEYTFLEDFSPLAGNLKLTAHCTDGTSREVLSRSQIRFVHPQYAIQADRGLHLLSFPTSSLYSTVMDVFGSVGEFWTLSETGNWIFTEELVSNRPYLANLNQNITALLPNQPVQDEISRSLNPGLNFVPNPHQRDYPLSQLYFNYTQDNYLWSHPWNMLLSRGWVDPYIWVLRDGALQTDTVLREGESCLIDLHREDPLALRFNPAVASGNWPEPNDEWNLLLRVKDARGLGSAVKLGSAQAGTDGYDEGLDLLYAAKPQLPVYPPELAIQTRDQASQALYYAEYKGLYPDYDTHSKSWTLILDQNGAGPLSFEIEPDRLPTNYRVDLSLNGQSFELLSGEPVNWLPATGGTVTVVLTVTGNAPLAAQDELVSVLKLKSYPNPFRDYIRLELPVSKDPAFSLEIYNLKGQRVKALHKGQNLSPKNLLWDGRDEHGNRCGTGIYFLKMSDSKTSLRQKILKL